MSRCERVLAWAGDAALAPSMSPRGQPADLSKEARHLVRHDARFDLRAPVAPLGSVAAVLPATAYRRPVGPFGPYLLGSSSRSTEPLIRAIRRVVFALPFTPRPLAPSSEAPPASKSPAVAGLLVARPERFELPTFGSVDRLQPAGTPRYGRLAQLSQPSNVGVWADSVPKVVPICRRGTHVVPT